MDATQQSFVEKYKKTGDKAESPTYYFPSVPSVLHPSLEHSWIRKVEKKRKKKKKKKRRLAH